MCKISRLNVTPLQWHHEEREKGQSVTGAQRNRQVNIILINPGDASLFGLTHIRTRLRNTHVTHRCRLRCDRQSHWCWRWRHCYVQSVINPLQLRGVCCFISDELQSFPHLRIIGSDEEDMEDSFMYSRHNQTLLLFIINNRESTESLMRFRAIEKAGAMISTVNITHGDQDNRENKNQYHGRLKYEQTWKFTNTKKKSQLFLFLLS